MWHEFRLQELERKIDLILRNTNQLLKGQQEEMADLKALTAQVTANTDAEASAITLIQGLAAQIAAASGDQAAVDALAAQLKTSATALAAAIVANTPAAPAAA